MLHLPIYDTIQWRIQDFPEEGAPTPQGGRQHTILLNFRKNCMKLKEFGPPGGGAHPKFYYVDPPLLSFTEIHAKVNDIRVGTKGQGNDIAGIQ